jgi:hypothetical protein
LKDPELVKINENLGKEEQPNFGISDDGILRFQNRFFVPKDMDLRRVILIEVHQSLYLVHPRSTKMYRDM